MQSKEQKREYNRSYRLAHPAYAREYAQRRRETLGKAGVASLNQYYSQKRKRLVLTHYGNGKLACVKCGFNDIRALSIDHISGGGTWGRKEKQHGGNNFYSWLVRNGFPVGYQTLCMNCQWIKRSENKENGHRSRLL